MGEIRFVGTGETRGYPYLVCKKNIYQIFTVICDNTLTSETTSSGILVLKNSLLFVCLLD